MFSQKEDMAPYVVLLDFKLVPYNGRHKLG